MGYSLVRRHGFTPDSSCFLVGPTTVLSTQRFDGLTAKELPDKVYEVNLEALRAGQYNDACSCGMNSLSNGFCKHVWVAASTLKEDVVSLVKKWATTGTILATWFFNTLNRVFRHV